MWDVAVLTIFPELFDSFLSASLVSKAIERNLLKVSTVNIRDFASPPHYKVDDTPYGGGAGMVMMVEPIMKALSSVKGRRPNTHTVLLSPSGTRFEQSKARQLAQRDSVTFICGRYEGVDQRVVELGVDEEISIGDFVVMGGEVPTMLLIEACLRLRPKVLHNDNSIQCESFSPDFGDGTLLEAPQYTRPEHYQGHSVPNVLLSGDHKKIEAWRLMQAEEKTTKVSKGKKK